MLLAALAIIGCSDDDRYWEMVRNQDIPSPNGNHIASVFEMSAFNTTAGECPQLSLRRPRQKPGKYGNLLQGQPGDIFTARWTSPTNLLVEYYTENAWASHPPQNTNTDGISVTFKRLSTR